MQCSAVQDTGELEQKEETQELSTSIVTISCDILNQWGGSKKESKSNLAILPHKKIKTSNYSCFLIKSNHTENIIKIKNGIFIKSGNSLRSAVNTINLPT